ncbi:hypothetical protein CSOJ01_05413 [Colletotrichum sojae]|uniref:CorA-like Mg2+ transporter n=1 Tax=Colletotrichum sojae TaxID=2175907 RepID=A0A8H6JF53_9PEZI|nr:hypothetical protein CSOJ01_05413 [Colletotrichum sojae]
MDPSLDLDECLFEETVNWCKVVKEQTHYVEIFDYSDPLYNSCEENPLAMDQFDDFLHSRGAFEMYKVPESVHLVSGLRLILQKDACDNETFAPWTISLPIEAYKSMVKTLNLPRMAVTTLSVVGIFFWCEMDDEDGRTCLKMVFRKGDVRKRGKTRGWELILSHNFGTGITSGYCKGTPSSDIVSSVMHLRACASDIEHAMLLPLIVFTSSSSAPPEQKQRNARDWLRRLEQAISLRNVVGADEIDANGVTANALGGTDLDAIARDLVDCQAQALWRPPASHISIIESMEEAARLFMNAVPEERRSPRMQRFQRRLLSRLHCYRERWRRIETYANATLQRVEVQRNVLRNFIADRDSKLNLQIASDQKKLAYLSKRDSESMKGISLLGAIFLPGTFLASIFSTTFFDFKDAPDMASVISPRFWVYWAATVPFTLVVVGLYFLWERRRQVLYRQDAESLERDIELLEAKVTKGIGERPLKRAVALSSG